MIYTDKINGKDMKDVALIVLSIKQNLSKSIVVKKSSRLNCDR